MAIYLVFLYEILIQIICLPFFGGTLRKLGAIHWGVLFFNFIFKTSRNSDFRSWLGLK